MDINNVFPRKYAKGEDLGGRDVTATILRVELVEMRPSPSAPPEKKPVLYVRGGKRGIILTNTLAHQIAALTGSSETDDWTNDRVVLYGKPMMVAGNKVIAIRAKAVPVEE